MRYEENEPPIHTQTVECFFSLVKRGHFGVYHLWNEQHLGRYCLIAGLLDVVKVGAAARIDPRDLRAFIDQAKRPASGEPLAVDTPP